MLFLPVDFHDYRLCEVNHFAIKVHAQLCDVFRLYCNRIGFRVVAGLDLRNARRLETADFHPVGTPAARSVRKPENVTGARYAPALVEKVEHFRVLVNEKLVPAFRNLTVFVVVVEFLELRRGVPGVFYRNCLILCTVGDVTGRFFAFAMNCRPHAPARGSIAAKRSAKCSPVCHVPCPPIERPCR